MRKRVYIAHPITIGDLNEHIENGIEVYIKLMRLGFAPMFPGFSAFAGGPCYTDSNKYCPEKLPRGTTHEDWLGIDLPWVSVAEAILRLPGESKGADREMDLAIRLGIPVFYSIEGLVEWKRSLAPKMIPLATSATNHEDLCTNEEGSDLMEGHHGNRYA